ncbi:hypothetical protein BS78_K072700 [Paspalum vaginatum]|uniref:Ubiquitin-like protease family profile domain-containing protein n=1 Tax=Paspalum vaginatum TaxID=158149 RepID=A0A9W7X8K0_9POAL|nr:hypothetical protein BS78_K072700 [Paspalum vaginatum]
MDSPTDPSTAYGSSDQNRQPNLYDDDPEPSAPGTSPARMNSGHRLVDRMPVNPKKMVFMSTQEIFEVPLRPENVTHTSRCKRHNSDDGPSDSDFVNPPVARGSKRTRSSRRPYTSRKPAPRSETRRANEIPCGPGVEGQPNNEYYATTSQILNVRCNPGDVLFTITLLTSNQYAALVALGFGPFLTMLTDAVESRNLLPWLLDRIKPNDMVLRIGPGKNIAVTPNIISMVLGIPHGGRNIKLYTTDEGRQFKKDLIQDLGQECLQDGDDIYISNLQEEILKGNVDDLFFRCFFMIVFNRYLFPTSTYKFDYSDITKSKHPEDFGEVDWSQEVFNNLQFAIRRWHDRDRTQSTQTGYGCSIFLIVLYLDHLHHTRSPPDWLSMPRIRFYNKATIESLTIVDRIKNLDGTEEYGFLPFKSTSSTCYAADASHHAWGDPSHFQQQQLPEIVVRLFDMFDTTITGNIKSIETLKLLTLRSQLQLADQCRRPVLDELISAQQTVNNPNIGECSMWNTAAADIAACDANQKDVPASPVMMCSPSATHQVPITPFGSPMTMVNTAPTLHVQGNDSTLSPKSLSADGITSCKEIPITLASNVVPDHGLSGYTVAFHSDLDKSPSTCASPTILEDAIRVATSQDCPSGAAIDATWSPSSSAAMDGCNPIQPQLSNVTTYADTDSPSKASSVSPKNHTPPPDNTCGQAPTLDSLGPPVTHIPINRMHSTRLTKIPPKYCSPFKFGVKSRKAPDRDLSLNMLDYVCDYDSPLKNLPIMRFNETNFSGEVIANSFADENFIHSHFVDAFVKCIAFDDLHQRPECGYRIFFSPVISSCLYDDSMKRDTHAPGFMFSQAVNLIKLSLPDKCDLKKAKMIFLPILSHRRWSVYCVNVGQRRIDVLDSHDYCQSTTSWRDYHDPLANTIIPNLSDALSLAAPRQFPCLKNWRHAPVQLTYHKNSNDSGLYGIRFLEYYDGEGHGSLKTTIDPERAKDSVS